MGRRVAAAFFERRGLLQLLGWRSRRGTCWNFFLAVPVSRSCGSTWGGDGGRLAQIYMLGLSLALTLLFCLSFLHLESFVTKCNGYCPRSRFQLLVTT